MLYICWEITDKTSTLILLNSSRQIHDPVLAYPMKSFSIILTVFYSEQLKTMQYLARTFAKSLQLSVLPVPAGPAGLAANEF